MSLQPQTAGKRFDYRMTSSLRGVSLACGLLIDYLRTGGKVRGGSLVRCAPVNHFALTSYLFTPVR